MEFFKEVKFINGNGLGDYFKRSEFKSMGHLPEFFCIRVYIDLLFPNLIFPNK